MTYILEALQTHTYGLIEKPETLQSFGVLHVMLPFMDKGDVSVHMDDGVRVLGWDWNRHNQSYNVHIEGPDGEGWREVRDQDPTPLQLIWNVDQPTVTERAWVTVYREDRKNYVESRAKNLSKADPNTLFRSSDDWYRNREYFYWQDGRTVIDPTEDAELMQWFDNVRYGLRTLYVEHMNTPEAAQPGMLEHGWSIPRWSHRYRELLGVGSITSARMAFGTMGRKHRFNGLALDGADWGCAWSTEDGTVTELYFDRKVCVVDDLVNAVNRVLADKKMRSTWLHDNQVWGFNILPKSTLMNPDTGHVGKTIDKLISDVRTAHDLIAQSKHPNRINEMVRLQKVLETLNGIRGLYEE